MVDLTRCEGENESRNDLLVAIELLKSECVKGNFGGKEVMMFDSPHVIIFTNKHFEYDKLSGDRWRVFGLDKDTKNYTE